MWSHSGLLDPIGENMDTDMVKGLSPAEGTFYREVVAVGVIVGVVVGVLSAIVTALIIGASNSETATAEPARPGVMRLTVPTPTSAKPATPVGYVQTAGDGPDDEGRSYACAAGYRSVKVPIGKKTDRDGTFISLKAKKTGPDAYDDQTSVTVKAKLGPRQSLGAVIVDTGAHHHAPTLYSQSVLTPTVGPGGTVHFVLASLAYADNYRYEGIAALTFCLSA